MYKLYHHSLCPSARMVRCLLNELMTEYVLIEERYWEDNESFLRLNPMGTVPVLLTSNGTVLNHTQLIVEYLHANYNQEIMYPSELNTLNVKKITIWFNEKLYNDSTKFLIQEKFVSAVHNGKQPNANILSLARYNLSLHYDYLTFLLENNTWLAGERMSLADIAAASQISTLDMMGEITWSKIPQIKDWYCIIKSRPGFRPLLKERIAGVNTPKHYSDLDF